MRCVKRNQQYFWYAQYLGNEEIIIDGNYTGTYEAKYSNPVKMRANISPAVGFSQVEQFGRAINYNKTLVTDDMHCPINEYSVLWIDVDPEVDSAGQATVPYNYTVSSVGRSFWSISYAIKRVEVGE